MNSNSNINGQGNGAGRNLHALNNLGLDPNDPLSQALALSQRSAALPTGGEASTLLGHFNRENLLAQQLLISALLNERQQQQSQLQQQTQQQQAIPSNAFSGMRPGGLDLLAAAQLQAQVAPPTMSSGLTNIGLMQSMPPLGLSNPLSLNGRGLTNSLLQHQFLQQQLQQQQLQNLPLVQSNGSFVPSQRSAFRTESSGTNQGDNITVPADVARSNGPIALAAAAARNDAQDDDDSDESRQPKKQSDQWTTRLKELAAYRKKHGHCSVPHKFTGNAALALWVKRQRYQRRIKHDGKGRKSALTDEREAILDQMGFVWDSHQTTWEERFNQLVKFREKHGHCNVPITAKDDKEKQLAVWVKCQRRQYRLIKKNGPESSAMTQDRIDKLDTLGLEWSPRTKSENHA